MRRFIGSSALALMLAAAACGPYQPADERAGGTRPARFVAQVACDTAPAAAATPGSPIPAATRNAAATPDITPPAPSARCNARPTASPESSAVPLVTSTPPPTVEPAIVPRFETATPEPPPSTAAPEPRITQEPTSAAATATARASRSVAYLSIGDGIQWGCCTEALGSSSPSLFRDYLETRLGRPVIWQTSGFGYQTTGAFINGINPGEQPQHEFAVELINYYRRAEIPVAAITLSIGGNNLVDIGRACPDPPCVDAFLAGLDELRADLHTIYARIAQAKDASTPMMVLLYYDANECGTYKGSGAAVDAWNAVIAEVATQYGAFLVDARSLFRGHCDWIDSNGLDANVAGHAAIAGAYQRVYETLPPEYTSLP